MWTRYIINIINLKNILEVTEFEITNDCKYIVIASDGVWEFLSNKRVMEIVHPFFKINDPAAAGEKLIEESVKCWKKVSLNIILRKMM